MTALPRPRPTSRLHDALHHRRPIVLVGDRRPFARAHFRPLPPRRFRRYAGRGGRSTSLRRLHSSRLVITGAHWSANLDLAALGRREARPAAMAAWLRHGRPLRCATLDPSSLRSLGRPAPPIPSPPPVAALGRRRGRGGPGRVLSLSPPGRRGVGRIVGRHALSGGRFAAAAKSHQVRHISQFRPGVAIAGTLRRPARPPALPVVRVRLRLKSSKEVPVGPAPLRSPRPPCHLGSEPVVNRSSATKAVLSPPTPIRIKSSRLRQPCASGGHPRKGPAVPGICESRPFTPKRNSSQALRLTTPDSNLPEA